MDNGKYIPGHLMSVEEIRNTPRGTVVFAVCSSRCGAGEPYPASCRDELEGIPCKVTDVIQGTYGIAWFALSSIISTGRGTCPAAYPCSAHDYRLALLEQEEEQEEFEYYGQR